MKKIVLFGKSGQVGWELQRALAPLGEIIALNRQSALCGDLTDLAGIAQTLRTLKPDVVVNAAAYTAVDKAESEPNEAALINTHAVAVMARECAAMGACLVHFSTDYVFDGSGTTPWQEEARTQPINLYGKSKLDGEQAILASGCVHFIVRTSWVYGAHGNNFIKTILRLARERDSLKIVGDQIGAPTGAELIADVTAHCLKVFFARPDTSGLYHLAAHGEVSWCDYAHFIVEEARALKEPFALKTLTAIPGSAYPLPAARPMNSRLDSSKLETTFSLTLPDWKLGVARSLKEILGVCG